MSDSNRLMLISPSQLRKTPAFARAQAIANVQDAPQHVVCVRSCTAVCWRSILDSLGDK